MYEQIVLVFNQLTQNPAFWLCLTICFFILGQQVFRLARYNPLCSPIIIAVALMIVLLKLTHVEYETYFQGASLIHFLLGPATVALAVPIYEQRRRLAKLWLPLTCGLVAGCSAAIISVIVLGAIFGLSTQTLISMIPKSVTTPIAMGISQSLGGLPDLTAALVVLTGIVGSIVGRPLFNLLRIKSEPVCGVSLGLSAHGMGTSSAFMIGPKAGAFGGLAMGLSGVISAFLAPLLAIPIMHLIGL